MTILEQVTLARNQDQHPDHIGTMHAYHSESHCERFPLPFFVSEGDRERMSAPDNWGAFPWPPLITITRENLFAAIGELEALAKWLEPQLIGFEVRAFRGGRELSLESS
jgi:hypothetical protein